MTWQRFPACFELVSPLHIGFLPNRPGTVVARTRCYVPGKNLWGAVTESVTPRLHPNPSADNYRDVGEAIREQVVFSYFYLSDGARIFAPDYTENGLAWGNLTDSAFRARFIGSNVSTAIGDAGGAEDASLHEIEFVRDRIGSPGQSSQKVLLMGVIWVRQDAGVTHSPLHSGDIFSHLSEADIVVGGERNYGFGRLRLVLAKMVSSVDVSEFWSEDPEVAIPTDGSHPLIGHAPYRQDAIFKGEIEILAGREFRHSGADADFHRPGLRITNAGYCFVPGTRLDGDGKAVRLDSWGRLIWV